MIYAANVLDADLAEGNPLVERCASTRRPRVELRHRLGAGMTRARRSNQAPPRAARRRRHRQPLHHRRHHHHPSPPPPPPPQVESELVELDDAERADFLESLGVSDASECGLEKLIAEVYELLRLRTYYTSGETETKAWTITEGTLAPQAAGVIHTDFEKGFIRAETVAYDDLVAAGGMKEAKEAGTVRSEGKEYEVKDADVMLFRFNN